MKERNGLEKTIRSELRERCSSRCGDNRYCETCEIYKTAKLIGQDIQPSDCVEYVAVQMILEERLRHS